MNAPDELSRSLRRSRAASPPRNGRPASTSPPPTGWSRISGWDDLVFTHISARIPGTEHHS